jgi:hypothetical protein
MKKITSVILILFALGGCKKDEIVTNQSSINIVNASVGIGTIKVNYFGKTINWSTLTGTAGLVNFGTSQILTVTNLVTDFPFIIVPSIDTLKPVINVKLPIENNGMYSLYTTGQTGAYEYIFSKESSIPYNFPDSAIAVRFINLSPNSPAVNITLASTPNIFEKSELLYKQRTDFKKYTDLNIVPIGSLTFQVRDAISNAILTSYTLPASPTSPYSTVSTSLSRFKSITLAIRGLAGITSGTNAYSLFPIPQY